MLVKLKDCLRYLLYVIIAETIFGGAGRVITFGSLTIRMALYAAALLLFLICLLMDWRNLIDNINIRDLNIKLVILFLLWVVFSAVYGYKVSGFNLSQIKGDVTGFISLILIFPCCYVFNDKKYFNTIAKLINACVIIQALGIIIAYFGIETHIINFDYFGIMVSNYYLGSLARIQPTTTRLFLKSSIFIQVGILILLGMLKRESSSKKRWLICLFLIVDGFALILTFTRGFWLASAATVILYIILNGYKQFIKPFFIVLLGLILLIGLNYAVNRNTRIVQSIGVRAGIIHIAGVDINDNEDVSSAEEKAEVSLNYRKNLKGEMIKRIEERPVIGTGFGLILSNIGQKVSHSEYMYLDIMMEMGLAGFAVYISVFLILFIRWLSVRKNLIETRKDFFLDEFTLGLLSIAITTAFNPFLNNPIGLMDLAVVFACVLASHKAIGAIK